MVNPIPQLYHDRLPVLGRQSLVPLFRDSSQGRGGAGNAGGGQQGGGASDPNFADVALLADFDGVNLGTTETDDSNDNRTLTFQNGALLSNEQSPFGTTSLKTLDQNAAEVAVSPAIDFNAQNWTVEAFVFLTSATFFNAQNFSRMFDRGDELLLGVGTDLTSAFLLGQINIVGALPSSLTDPNPLTLNQWTHVALTRDGSLFRLWRDGSMVDEQTANPFVFTNSLGHMVIGHQFLVPNGRTWNGYIGPFRITMVTRYTANFTPPSAPFPTS